MTRISNDLLDCTIYMYPSVSDAEEGKHTGGSGFLISVPSQNSKGFNYIYAVTNRHVIEQGNFFIRMNKIGGGILVQGTILDNWIRAYQDDVAICQIFLIPNTVNFRTVPLEMFATEEVVSDYNLGLGQDVVMIGRFVNYDGTQQNTPTARFGNLAMMTYPVKGQDNFVQDSFVVEMRSLSGFSGSPVFVYLQTTPLVAQRWMGKLDFMDRDPRYTLGGTSLWLLGIDWGHGRENEWTERILNRANNLLTRNDIFGDGDKTNLGWRVKSNSGLTNVVPASRLYKLIFDEEAVNQRKYFENLFVKDNLKLYVEKHRKILMDPRLLKGKFRTNK